MALDDIQSAPRNGQAIRAAPDTLKPLLGERLQTGLALREQHAHTTTYIPNQPPDAVAFAESLEDVETVVRVCAEHGAPVIAFGSGTLLEGYVNALAGGVSLDLSRMNRLLAVNADDLDRTMEAGLTRQELNAQLRDTGLFFPIGPGANAGLGRMAATRASDTNAVRYGTMRAGGAPAGDR